MEGPCPGQNDGLSDDGVIAHAVIGLTEQCYCSLMLLNNIAHARAVLFERAEIGFELVWGECCKIEWFLIG